MDVVHLTTEVIVNLWNEISLCRPWILPTPVTHVENVSTHTNKSCGVDCPRIILFDASTPADPNFIEALNLPIR